jgi:hypothetical protein
MDVSASSSSARLLVAADSPITAAMHLVRVVRLLKTVAISLWRWRCR